MDLNATQLLEAAREAEGLINLGQPVLESVRQAVNEVRTRHDLGEPEALSLTAPDECSVVFRLYFYNRNHI